MTLTGVLAGAKAEISCTAGRLEAQPGAEGETSVDKFELTTCTVKKPTGCALSGPIVGSATGVIEEVGGKLQEKLTGSGSGETMAELTFANSESCSLKNQTVKLTGSQICEFDAGIHTNQEKHELICKTTGSTNLKLGGNKVTYEGTATLESGSGAYWLQN